ncbi:leukocyte immunoglobulin-like receptor subfamily B member 1 isoform X2 [Chelonia mydas]|uniref:leukocyte immunoglobulin-like receptor subfamily B member 1 isoform X2 n=1 Tax=Chelonia mydas TaxID=8469 RepID=UPI001CA7BE2F|nr:leukocyte immunoglobulin-like receptor subfamily B member 1 isoform X2 [Chelonia mydas]
MVSALTVLLGCWLAGRSGALGQGSLPKPSISISPGGVIPIGGNVTIRFWHQRLGMRFILSKDGDGNLPTYRDPASYVAEFPITSARREHGGSYTCCYIYRTGPAAFSEPSDPVQIIVAGSSSSCSSRPLVAQAGHCRNQTSGPQAPRGAQISPRPTSPTWR